MTTLDLSLWADQPDTVHPYATAAEAAAVADARWLLGQVVEVLNAGGDGDEHAFHPPVRARVYYVDTENWQEDDTGASLDPYVHLVFLDPVDAKAFPPDEDGKQRGWWYARTHRVVWED
jgi:hypothetical protein